jgi:integrase
LTTELSSRFHTNSTEFGRGRRLPMWGDGRLFKRGGRWWIAYYAPHEGRRIEQREPGGRTEGEARRLLRQRHRELAIHTAGLRLFQGPRQERVTLHEILQALEKDLEVRGRRSLPQAKSHLKPVRAFFGETRALAVTPDRLRDYVQARQEAGAAPATINRQLEFIQRAFALAVEAGTLSHAPRMPRLPERNARQGFFERAELEAVLTHLGDPDVHDFVDWFAWTGMRPGEIRALTWAAFDRETWTLRLHAKDAKTGHGRVLALEGPLRRIVERRVVSRRLDSSLIFHRHGRPVGDIRKHWRKACKAAGVAGRLLYDLRRTAIRNMVRAGVDPSVAMKVSGHRTRAVFDRYNIIAEADLRDAVLKTEAYVRTLPTDRKVVPLQSNPS